MYQIWISLRMTPAESKNSIFNPSQVLCFFVLPQEKTPKFYAYHIYPLGMPSWYEFFLKNNHII